MSLKGIAVFDVEGVILPKRRYLLLEVARSLPKLKLLMIFLAGLLYYLRIYSLKKAFLFVLKNLRGFSSNELYKALHGLKITPGARETIGLLNSLGYKTALISSGLPSDIVDKLREKLSADYAYGVKIEYRKGKITGSVLDSRVLEPGGKENILREICEREKLDIRNCIAVGDDRENLSLFKSCGRSIGFNIDPGLSVYVDSVVMSYDLRDIFPALSGKKLISSPLTINKVVREAIHASAIFVPLLSLIVAPLLIVFLIVLVVLIYLIAEYKLISGVRFPIISDVRDIASLEEERYGIAIAPVYFALGIAVTLALFPNSYGFAAIAVFALGDSVATITGHLFGRTVLPYNKAKTTEGFLMGAIAGFLGALLFVDLYIAITAAIIGMLIESLPMPVNDNLTMPILTSAILSFVF